MYQKKDSKRIISYELLVMNYDLIRKFCANPGKFLSL